MSCCNTSPCTPSTGNPCPSYPNTNCVVYSGGLLPCLGVFSNERLTDILEKIDAKLCAVPRQRYIFENALTESPDYTVHLGGSLIENTSITLSTHSLTVTADPGNSFILPANGNIVFPRLPNTQDFILTTDANGVVFLADPQTFFNPPLYTFVNGLSETGFVAKLGGPLIENTNIDFTTFNLSLSNVPAGTPVEGLALDSEGNIITGSVASTQRFGIEDNTSIQNRIFDFDGFNFTYNNVPVTATPSRLLTLDSSHNITQSEQTLPLHTGYIPMSVNGNFADSTGNIIINTNVVPIPLVVSVATTVPLPSLTYNNGTAGVGATLTATGNGALPTIDGQTVTAGVTILVKDQVNQIQNGVYTVTQVGDGSTPFILTRTTSSDQTAELYPQGVTVANGNVNAALLFLQQTADPVVGTNNIIYDFTLPLKPTWQNTLDNSSTLTRNNTIVGGGFDFTFGGVGTFDLQANTSTIIDSPELHVTLPSSPGYVLTDVAGDGNLTLEPVTLSSWKAPLSASFAATPGLSGGQVGYYQVTGRQSGIITTEALITFTFSETSTWSRIFVTTSSSQPVTGNMVIIARKNSTNTSLVVTIPAGSVAGTYSNISTTVAITAGDNLDYQITNNASTTGATLISIGSTLFA